MNGQHVGYIRVSSIDQNHERQLADLQLDRIFKDKVSGATTNRPQLKACLDHLREGDTLHVHSMDRLARNLRDLQNIVDGLTRRKVTVHFHKESLVFTGDSDSMSRLMLQIMGAVAEFERSLIKERQREGIEQAKKKGTQFGRKPKLTDAQVDKAVEMLKQGVDKKSIAEALEVSRQTLYRALDMRGIKTTSRVVYEVEVSG